MRRAICGVMSGRRATTWPELGSTKRMAASRLAPPRPSASTSSYSKAGVMTRANPQRSNTPGSVSAMRLREAAARGAKSRIPVGRRKEGESLIGQQTSAAGARGAVRPPLLIDRVLDDAVFQETDEDL